MRIVSLLPSATEIVCALGYQDQLVGRSHECDFPSGVEGLPVLTAPSFEVGGSSQEIDQNVKSLVEKGLSLYQVEADLLKELNPDVIVTQTQCDVCAVSEDELAKALGDWTGSEVQIVSLKPDSLEDIYEDFRRVGRALHTQEAAESLIQKIKSEISITGFKTKPSVFCMEWMDPIMAAGNWMPQLVEKAGGQSLLSQEGSHSPYVDWDQIAKADPDIMILMPCGFDISRTSQEVSMLKKLPGWEKLSAVRGNKIFITDGNQYFNRPGPRILESFKILLELFHPDQFSQKYKDIAWIPFNAVSLGSE